MDTLTNWDDWKIFLKVAECGSLNKAAKELNIGQPTISRRMADLEVAIGDKLFIRGTDGIELTRKALKILPSVQGMAAWAHQVEIDSKIKNALHTGIVKITAPPGIAYDYLVTFAKRMRSKYPDIQIEISSNMNVLNLSRGEADIALRTVESKESDLVTICKSTFPMRVFVAKSYAKKLPKKINIQQLDWVSFSPGLQNLRMHQELERLIPNFKPVFMADDFILLIEACKRGLGATILPKTKYPHSITQDLVELNIDLGKEAHGTVYLVCHKKMQDLPKIKNILDEIAKDLSEI